MININSSPTITAPPINGDLYDIESALTSDEHDILLRWRAFMRSEVAPVINDYWERGEFPMHLIPKLGALTMDTIGKGQTHIPRMSPLLSGMLTAEVARVDPSLCSFLGVHRRLCMTSIWLVRLSRSKGSLAAIAAAHGEDRLMGIDRAAGR